MIIEELPGNLILRDYNKKELISYALSFFSEKKKRIENIVNLISGELTHIAARFPSIVKHCFQISSF